MSRLDDVRARHAARLRTRAAKGDGATQMSTLVDDDVAWLLGEVERLTKSVGAFSTARDRAKEGWQRANEEVARRDKVLEEVSALARHHEAEAQRHDNAETLTIGDGDRAYRAARTHEAFARSIRAALDAEVTP